MFRLLVALTICINVCFSKHHHKATQQIFQSRLNFDEANPGPIIGILSESVPSELEKQYKWAQSSLFQAYSSFAQAGGTQVVPILIDRTNDYYQHKFNSINGMIFAGEDVSLSNKGFTDAVSYFLKLAKQANDNNDYFPVLGIGAGFAAMSNELAASEVVSSCSAEDVALRLNMTSDYVQSRLFKNIPMDVNESLTTKSVTFNNHVKCLTTQTVSGGPLSKIIHVLSTNVDKNNLQFVSTYETLKYPFYAFQWNPAFNPFEWSFQLPNIPHSLEAVQVTQYISNFFAEEARKSKHHFTDPHDEMFSLIWHFQLYYITNVDTTIRVMYLFKNSTK